MFQVLIVFHVLLAIGIVVFVLLQQGKGAEMGAAFGSGASGTVFGAQGSASFLSRTTAVLAALFFITSLSLAYFSDFQSGKKKDIIDVLKSGEVPPVPQAQEPVPATSDMPVTDAPVVMPESVQIQKEGSK